MVHASFAFYVNSLPWSENMMPGFPQLSLSRQAEP